jgi:hypothetical protein
MSRDIDNVIRERQAAVDRLEDVKHPNPKQLDALVTNYRTLVAALREKARGGTPAEPPTTPPAPPVSQPPATSPGGILGPEASEGVPGAPPPEQIAEYERAKEAFLDAQDDVFIAQGKLHGREGAERASMEREEGIALAKSIGVYDVLIKNYPTFFGPEPGPGESA